MTSRLFVDVLDVVLAQMSPTLVPPERMPALRQVAALLPPVFPAGLEMPLVYGGPVDLQQNVLAGNGDPEIAARHFGRLLAEGIAPADPGWDRIELLLRAWTDPATPWQKSVRDLWLEFDLHTNPGRTLPLPAVFLGLDTDGVSIEEAETVLETVLADLTPTSIPAGTFSNLRRCAAACRQGARISHVGCMLSRPEAGLRVNVALVPADRIAPFLEAVEWPGSLTRVERLLDRFFPLVDGIALALDVGARVGPRLGLESTVRERRRRRLRETALLDLLVELDCCSVAERDALADLRRVIGPSQCRSPWPAGMIVSDIANAASGISAVSMGLNHVKLDLVGGSPLRAKAYLYFRPRSLGTTTDEDATGAGGGRVIAAAFSAGPSSRLEHAIEGGHEFLAGARGQAGLWRDFDIEGGGDHFVTAVVGAIIAEDSRPRAQREAVMAWHALARRAESAGAWGWNVLIAPDADTTAWALRLADQIGQGASAPARRARRILRRYRAPGGGMRPNLLTSFPGESPDAVKGWIAVHDCVTAAAAGLGGALGAGARRHLRASQRSDGSWLAYWWNDDAYATGLAAESLASLGNPSDRSRVTAAFDWAVRRLSEDGAVVAEALGGPSPFATALTVRALAAGEDAESVRVAVENVSRWLAANQRADGSWVSSADMWLPPHDADPDEPPGGAVLCFDERRIFTTAAVLAALLRAKRVLEAGAGKSVSGSSGQPSRADARPAAPRR